MCEESTSPMLSQIQFVITTNYAHLATYVYIYIYKIKHTITTNISLIYMSFKQYFEFKSCERR